MPNTPSFSKALFSGEIHEELIFPYPRPDAEERRKVDEIVAAAKSFLEDVGYDPKAAEERGWVGDEVIAGLGERGLLGLYIDPKYGGKGLSQTGYCMVFERIGVVDPALAVVMGVHESIGMKGIHMFGTDEQKERWLPDLATGKKLAAFALTEPNAGSDAYHIETRAVRQSDGSFRLDGEKRWIGNGSKDVLTVFARTDDGDHVALIVEKGMEGLEVGPGYDTMGIRANDLRQLRFNGVRVPQENMLGEVGEGFQIAMQVLNNGRMSLGTGTVGAAKWLLDLTVEHVSERHQFGQPLADCPLVEEKIGWLVTYLYGLEAMCFLTTGLVDRGVADYSLESAICKVSGTEFIWYAANRAFQLAGGRAYMRDEPYEKILRDIRVFPIFEGSNDVLRLFIALSGLEPLGKELEGLADFDLREPLRSIGVLASYVENRIKREVAPSKLTKSHASLEEQADRASEGVERLREVSERLLRKHGRNIKDEQGALKRLSHAAMDLYGQFATLARVSDVLDDGGPEVAGEESYIAQTFCNRAAVRVDRWLDQIENNDDDRMHSIARAAYRRQSYGHGI